MSTPTPEQPQRWLGVDPVACDGVGMCAHLAPGLVELDRWGYPIMPRTPISPVTSKAAQSAVAACPRKALFLSPSVPRGVKPVNR